MHLEIATEAETCSKNILEELSLRFIISVNIVQMKYNTLFLKATRKNASADQGNVVHQAAPFKPVIGSKDWII